MNYKNRKKEQFINESAEPHKPIGGGARKTGRRQAAEVLKVSRRLFETAQDGILLLDKEGDN